MIFFSFVYIFLACLRSCISFCLLSYLLFFLQSLLWSLLSNRLYFSTFTIILVSLLYNILSLLLYNRRIYSPSFLPLILYGSLSIGLPFSWYYDGITTVLRRYYDGITTSLFDYDIISLLGLELKATVRVSLLHYVPVLPWRVTTPTLFLIFYLGVNGHFSQNFAGTRTTFLSYFYKTPLILLNILLY